MPSPGKPQPSASALKASPAASFSQRLLWVGALFLGAIALFLIASQARNIPAPALAPAATPVNLLQPTFQLEQAAVTSASLSSASDANTWLMEAGNPARSRQSPATLHLPTKEQGFLGTISATGNNGSQPIIVGKIMLIETDKELRAIDRSTGQQLWAFVERGSYISPAIFGSLALIRVEADNKGELIAIDLQNGTKRWIFTPRRISSASTNFYGGHIGSPLIVDGIAYVSAGGEVYALDAVTGALRWTFATQELVTSSLAAAQGSLYISDFRYIYAIDQQKGSLLWAKENETTFSFAPVVSGEYVIIARGTQLVALDRSTGQQRWAFSPKDEALTPAGADGTLAYAKSTNTLYAIDLASGVKRWQYHNAEFVSLPSISSQHMFLVEGMGANTILTALDSASGTAVWQLAYGKLARSGPIVVNNSLYTRMEDGRVLAFRSP